MIELPKGVVLRDLLLFLKNIGLKSSSILRDYEDGLIPLYDSSENLHQKYNHKDPVTSADLAINKFITEEFISNYSTVQWEVITEENSKENLSAELFGNPTRSSNSYTLSLRLPLSPIFCITIGSLMS